MFMTANWFRHSGIGAARCGTDCRGTTQFDIKPLSFVRRAAGKHVVLLVSGDVDHGTDEQAVLEDTALRLILFPALQVDGKVIPLHVTRRYRL